MTISIIELANLLKSNEFYFSRVDFIKIIVIFPIFSYQFHINEQDHAPCTTDQMFFYPLKIAKFTEMRKNNVLALI
jgi:hypothetical protein